MGLHQQMSTTLWCEAAQEVVLNRCTLMHIFSSIPADAQVESNEDSEAMLMYRPEHVPFSSNPYTLFDDGQY
jgi:hypothetical protein